MKRIFFLVLVILCSLSVIGASVSEKIHSNIQSKLDSAKPVSVIVQFDEKPSSAQMSELEANGCKVKYVPRRLNLVVAECSGKKVRSVAESSKVKFVWEDEVFEPLLDYSASQINAQAAWTSGYDGSGVNVSLIDSGINSSHPALLGRVVLEQDFTFENTTVNACDHGTRIASVIVSTNDTYKGIAHGASLFNAKAAKVLFPPDTCSLSSTDIMEAIDWSIEHGAQVIELSAGSPISNCSWSITAAYVNATVTEKNIPIIIPAGNTGSGNNTINTPGCSQNAITVGAVDDANAIASFSSRGPVIEEITYLKPDVVAPGVNIQTANLNGNGFSDASGTSLSAPHVAGVVAMMFQANPYLNYSQVKQILHDTATDLGYDENAQGGGLVDASAAVNAALSAPVPPPAVVLSISDTPDPVLEGQQINYTLLINNTGTGPAFNVTITESYPAGATFVSSSPAPSSGNNVFSLDTLNDKTYIAINIILNVTMGAQNGSVLNNSYNATFAHFDGTPELLTASTTTVVLENSPSLVLSITDTPDPVLEGQQINYTLTINNSGTGSAYNVTVNETYPTGTIFNSATPAPTSGNNMFTLGTLGNGTSTIITISLNTTVDILQNGTALNNSVNVTFANWNGTNNSLSASATTIFAALPNYPALLVYYATSGAADKPKVRNITDSSGLLAQEELLSLGSGSDASWIRVAESPVRTEEAIVIHDDTDDVSVQIRNKLGVGNLKKLTTSAGGITERRMDVAYDKNGRAIIVYAKNSPVLSYEIWNGSVYVENGTLLNDSCTSNIAWVEVAAKPNATELIAMYQDSNGSYCAQVWNGSNWGDKKLFSQDAGITSQKFDIGYEQSSGQALAAFETSTMGVIGYCAWNGTVWCSNISTLSDRGAQNDWVRLAAQRGSDRLLLGALQDGNSDVDVIEWSGSSFGTWKNIDGNVEIAGERTMDVSYIGNSGMGMIVYDDSNSHVPSYATCSNSSACSAGTWSSVATTTNSSNNCGEVSDLKYVALADDPLSNKVLLYATSQANHYKCAQFFNGSSWGSWNSNLGSGTASNSTEDISAVFDSK